ncbi:DeoR/GlpR family DNA-binding transcription regulator [Tropicimonas isoalkanivorans]|uniref:Transcriptional regulator, DeoR family n=1 Tax=Tropicimonas isoalkanivorans TaxID=441112 RepID=A0A1I1DF84_9RHOB|nr:DeoR/GlpR family DNA-binding transcription regulator [Tropicimonas isoalkanivorans]SFB73046.1 transcriptional regulator, DeoR family [Tropicimonas isoalkanivorans]
MTDALTERQNEIMTLLRRRDSVDVETLAERFQVSTQTIRNDLRELAERGLVLRTHGGARRAGSASNYAYSERRRIRQQEKEWIGLQAAELIPNHCSVMLNIGTSTEQVARALTNHEGLVVLSNNINIINVLVGSKARELILVGGSVRQTDGAIVGADAVDFISRYKADFAVIGASALDADGAILDYDAREVSVARSILKNSRTRILVCDSSKFDRTAPVRICDVADLDYVVTDRPPPEDFLAAAKRGHTKVLMMDEEDGKQIISA